MRLAHYFLGYTEAVRSLLYSDDGKITGRTQNPQRGVWLHLLVLRDGSRHCALHYLSCLLFRSAWWFLSS